VVDAVLVAGVAEGVAVADAPAEWCITISSIVILPSWFKSSAAAELPRKPCSSGSRIMLPFLSCCFTRLVAQACRLIFGEPLDDAVVEELELVLGVELLDVDGRDELPELLEFEPDDDELLPPLLERSSLRRSSLRRSSPRERLLRQSERPRSPYRPRSRSRRSSRLPLSERELLPLDCWARARRPVRAAATTAATTSIKHL
jgi:hypothetical protein